MDQIPMFTAGAVLALAVLCIRSRAAGAALGILIGGLLCFVHELKGWDATPVLAVCMLCGAVLAGFLRREASSGGDGDFFGECCSVFRSLAEKDFGLATAVGTDGRTLALGREFVNHVVSSQEPSFIKDAAASEFYLWAMSTPLLAGFFAAKTGRLESGTALIWADKSVREEAMQNLFYLLIFSRPFLRALFREHVSMLARHDDGSNGAQHLALGMKLTSAGVRAAFQTGATLELGRPEEEEK